MKLSLAFSSCPNDTFMFHALVHGLVDTEGLSFDVDIYDVEELNERAQRETYDVTKISYHGWFTVRDRYDILSSGSALGWDCGPLLVRRADDAGVMERRPLRIAVPGRYTALGNIIAANDKGAIVSPFLSDEAIHVIEETLDVNVGFSGCLAYSWSTR